MKKVIIIIAILASVSSLAGLLTSNDHEKEMFTSIHGEEVTLDGKGLYALDSVSVAAQGRASDAITLLVFVPLLLWHGLRDKSFNRLMRMGLLGYFLYTYVSYVFLWQYNELFLVYIVLMSSSGYGLALSIMSVIKHRDIEGVGPDFPKKLVANTLYLISGLVGFMWLSLLVKGLVSGQVLAMLEHYHTLVIQAMDLGIVVPLGFFAAYQVKRETKVGFLLALIMLVKGMSLVLAVDAMIINMLLTESEISLIQASLFGVITLALAYVCLKSFGTLTLQDRS